MDRLLKAFHVGLRESGLRAGRGVRYPQALRDLAVAYSREATRSGHSRRRIAESLGVSEVTLNRWSGGAGSDLPGSVEPALVHEVVLTGATCEGSLVLVTPEGFRVEGLSLAELPAIVRALR